ncbi:fluoride efflux transporter CrcB [Proteobacteria bacterium 005FR1]|nr:fluoride efflux transporter CrcB [Proteobacteria bacterium 005FR1]
MQWLAIAIGGALGAMGRYAMVAYAFPVLANRFPLGTLVANLAGSFLLGVCYVVIVENSLLGSQWRLALMTGFLGAFTTFSAFALEAVQLWQYGQPVMATGYVLLSVIGCCLAVVLALAITSRLIG